MTFQRRINECNTFNKINFFKFYVNNFHVGYIKKKNLKGLKLLYVNRSTVPAITHVDYSARVQTVHRETNPKYYKLISEFKKKTGCPVIVNTSFNVRGEPIVNTPEDAFKCFMGTEMDILVIENCLIRKEKQNTSLKIDYKNKYKLVLK